MYRNLNQISARIKPRKERPVRFGPFTGGLVTSRPVDMLAATECSEYQNIVIDDQGNPRCRPGWSKVCSGMSGSVYHVKDVRVQGTWYTIISTTQGSTYRLYKQNGTSVTQIGGDSTFEGPITFVGLKDYLIIFDGGYVKYWDGSSIDLLPDQGIGSTNYFVQNGAGELSNSSTLTYKCFYIYSSIKTLAIKFTTPDWTSGYTMPPIGFSLRLMRYGNGAISGYESEKPYMRIRKVSDLSVMAAKQLMDLNEIPTGDLDQDDPDVDGFKEFHYTFAASDITTELSPDTEYYLCYEMGYGNVEHHTKVLGIQNVPAGYGYYDGQTPPTAMKAYANAAPMFNLNGELPISLKTGVSSSSRIFGIEGTGSDNPGRLWYCGAGNPFDWSSPNYGGYLDTGRDIAGIVEFYDDVWLFGSAKAPSLTRISGSTPANYAQTQSVQQVSSHQTAIITTPDDILFYHPAGVNSINTMTEFGDIRSSNRSDNISDIVTAGYDTTAVMGYEPIYGLCLLKLNDGEGQRIYAFHTRIGGRKTRYYPVSKWELNLPQVGGNDQAITAFGQGEDGLYMGTDQGVLYKLNDSVLTDDGQTPTYAMKSGVVVVPHDDMTARRFYSGIRSDGNGGSAVIKFYRDFSTTALLTKTVTLPTDLSDPNPDSGSNYLKNFSRGRLNFNFSALQVGYETITASGANPIWFGPLEITAQ